MRIRMTGKFEDDLSVTKAEMEFLLVVGNLVTFAKSFGFVPYSDVTRQNITDVLSEWNGSK